MRVVNPPAVTGEMLDVSPVTVSALGGTRLPHRLARAVSRESRAEFGRAYSAVLFLDVSPAAAKHMRGPALASRNRLRHREHANPFSNRTRPLRVMLDPMLDHSNSTVRNVLKLARHYQVVEMLATSLDHNIMPEHVQRVDLIRLENQGNGEDWSAEFNNSSIWVPMMAGYEDVASHAFGQMDPESAHRAVVTGQTAIFAECDLFLTINATLLDARDKIGGWAADVGPVSPLELIRMLGVLFRLAGFLPTSVNSTVLGGVYDATIQGWLPSYLPLYRHLCFDDGEDDILDYFDGLMGNCALSLMALDRLATLHFAEDTDAANNQSVAQQQYESSSVVIGLTSALESLTWVFFKFAGARANRRNVTFRKLLYEPTARQDKLWTTSVSEYCPEGVSALRDGFKPTLRLVVHFRDLLQHHVPIPTAVAQFGEVLGVNGGARFIDKLKAGVLRREPHPNETLGWLASHDAMGVLPDAVMPYPFFRSCIVDLLQVVERVLSALCSRMEVSHSGEVYPRFWGRHGIDLELIRLLTSEL